MPAELSIWAHFYQPGRVIPLPEGGSLDVVSWVNEEIYRQTYWPILLHPEVYAERIPLDPKKFPDGMIFSLYASLREWMVINHQKDFEGLRGKVRRMGDEPRYRILGDPLFHDILTEGFMDERDREILLTAGRIAMKEDLGVEPLGIWLPEMAVSTAVLESCYRQGYRFVVLEDYQVDGWATNPVEVVLPHGGRMVVFGADSGFSSQVSRNPALSVDGDAFLAGIGGGGRDRFIATDGETFGHHYPNRDQFLLWVANWERMVRWGVVPLSVKERLGKKLARATIREETSWSCSHGTRRWRGECNCDNPAVEILREKQYFYGQLMKQKEDIKRELDRILPGWHKWFPMLLAANRHYLFGDPRAKNEVEDLDVSAKAKRKLDAYMWTFVGLTSCAWFFGEKNSPTREIARTAVGVLDRIP